MNSPSAVSMLTQTSFAVPSGSTPSQVYRAPRVRSSTNTGQDTDASSPPPTYFACTACWISSALVTGTADPLRNAAAGAPTARRVSRIKVTSGPEPATRVRRPIR